ncbi:MAG: ABC transporter substrate-binding protein [Phycisphaerae bacterium]|nr:ABC transporter substrate-binding protein [Phycisphaerae bacterium]
MSRRGLASLPFLFATVLAAVTLTLTHTPARAEVVPASQPSSALRVAALLPLSGDLAPLGASVRQGLELAAARVNRDGTFAGRPIQISFLDTQAKFSQPATLAAAAILADQADALIGGLEGPAAVAIRPVAEKRRTVFLVLSTSSRFVADGGRYTWRVSTSGTQLADAMATFARETLKAERAAISSDVVAEQSSLAADRFADQFVKFGGQVARIDSVHPSRDAPTIAELGSRAGQAKAEVLFTSLGADQLLGYVGGFRTKAPDAPVLLAPPPWGANGVLAAGAEALRPGYVAVPFAIDDPDARVRAFVDEWSKAHPATQPDAFSATAYDSVMLLAEAARKRDAIGGELRDRLAAIRNLPGVLGPMSVSEAGEIVRQVPICRLEAMAGKEPGNRLVFLQRVQLNGFKPPTSQPVDHPK